MVIRRIREHVVKQNWFAVAIDLAIVGIGVFLGTQANNLNEARIERAKADTYRARLIRELEFNERYYRQQAVYYGQVRNHGVAALAALDRPGGAEAFLVDAYQATQMDLTPIKHFIFDEMVSAGLVGLLGSEAVQEKASDYYLSVVTNASQLLETPPYRDMVRREMSYDVQVAIRARCGERPVRVGDQTIGWTLPDRCATGLPLTRLNAAASHLRSVTGFEQALTRELSATEQKETLLRSGVGESRVLIDGLRGATR